MASGRVHTCRITSSGIQVGRIVAYHSQHLWVENKEQKRLGGGSVIVHTPLCAVQWRIEHVQPLVPGPHEVEVGQLERQPLGAAAPQLRVHHLRARAASELRRRGVMGTHESIRYISSATLCMSDEIMKKMKMQGIAFFHVGIDFAGNP